MLHVKNAIRATFKKTDKKQQYAKDQQKRIVELDVKDIEGQIYDAQKIIKGLEVNFGFIEDAEKKRIYQLLTAYALKRKAEETNQDMTKLEET